MSETKTTTSSPLAWIAPAVVVLLFARIVGFGYLNWDDHLTIFENPALRPVTAHTFVEAWTSAHLSLWIPLTHSLWALLAWIGSERNGIDPLAFRATSIALHMVTTWIVFDLLLKLTRSDRAALVGSLLFAVHPVQVESVAWISGQKDLLAGLFILASTRAFVVWRENPSRLRFIITLGLAMLAMLSKPAAVTTPLVWFGVVLLDRIDKRSLLLISMGLLCAIPIVIVARFAQPATLLEGVAPLDRLLVAGDALAFDLKHLVAPWPLVVDYARTPQSVAFSSSTALWWIVPMMLISLGVLLRKSFPELLAGVCIVIACVLPVLGLMPFEFQKYSTVSDHYLYAAVLGPALIVAGIVVRRRALIGVVMTLLIVTMIVSFRQVDVWRDDQSLFKHNLHHLPQSLAANRTLAYLATERGDLAWAEHYYRATARFRPDDDLSAYNFANFLARQNRLDEAIEEYNRAIEIRSDHPSYRYNRALVLMQLNRPREALSDVQIMLKLDPEYPGATRLHDRLVEIIDPKDPLEPIEK